MAFWNANCSPAPPSAGGPVAFPQCFNLRGNAGRNILRGPGLVSFDFSMGKSFRFPLRHETGELQIRVDAQNVFNQKAAQILYPFYNRFRTNSSELNYTTFDFSKPYDYKALVAGTSDALTKSYGAIDPRFGKGDLFRTGFVGRLGVRFTF